MNQAKLELWKVSGCPVESFYPTIEAALENYDALVEYDSPYVNGIVVYDDLGQIVREWQRKGVAGA